MPLTSPGLPGQFGSVQPPKAPPVSALRVLVVEDNEGAAESLTAFLRILGHDVEVACDGVAALAAIRRAPPRVALLDIGLPGMDGYELARRIRREPAVRGVVLIALTGYGRDEDRDLAAAAGFDHHLVKPIDPEALEDLLARLASGDPSA